MPFTAFDPTTGAERYTIPALDAAASDAAVAAVHAAQRAWRSVSLDERAWWPAALARALTAHRETLARALSDEMGKPIVAARAEVDKCIDLCHRAPALAAIALADETLQDDAVMHVTLRHAPLGTVLAIMPWNFPYWQALRFAVPTLLAGNGVLIKPAPSVPGSALALERCFAQAAAEGMDAGHAVPPVAVLLIEEDAIDALIADARIVGVTLTGSDRAGRHVAAVAGQHLKKVVLELGGSDPFIVLPDASVDDAARVGALARTVNSGQSCVAAKRFIVCDAVYDAFLAGFVAHMQALRVGDPHDEATQVGPLATARGRAGLAAQVQRFVNAGARAVLGGNDTSLPGYYFPPTVLVDVPPDAPVACEEVFGPVACVYRVPDETAAIALANATPFGLGASVWTASDAAADRSIAALEAGMIFVNDMVVSDPRYPFGGVKQSGVGRELGPIGFREFTNPQTIRRLRRR